MPSRSVALISIALISIALLIGCTTGSAPRDGDWASLLEVRAERVEDETVVVVLEAVRGWYVNTLYPGIEIELELAETKRLGGDVVTYEDRAAHDKAKRAVFTADAADLGGVSDLRGVYTAVVCRDEICSPPFNGEIAVTIEDVRGG